MTKDLHRARQLLDSHNLTCALVFGEQVHTSVHRGVRPLMELLDSGGDFRGYSAADKVVGKATAFLYVLLGVHAVYARTVSRSAAAVLQQYGIALEYGAMVEAIANRDRTGFCPMESAVRNIDDPQQAHAAVVQTLKKLQAGSP